MRVVLYLSVVSSCTTAAGLAATPPQGPISDHIAGLPTYTLNGVNTHLGLWPPRYPTNTFPLCITRSTAWLWVVQAEFSFRLDLPVLRLGSGNLLVFSFSPLGQFVQHSKALPTPRWLKMSPSSFQEAQPCPSLTSLQGSSESACALYQLRDAFSPILALLHILESQGSDPRFLDGNHFHRGWEAL